LLCHILKNVIAIVLSQRTFIKATQAWLNLSLVCETRPLCLIFTIICYL